ncbi:MAG TPA: hypothetical protein VGM56_02905 [Byssovorax sp.]
MKAFLSSTSGRVLLFGFAVAFAATGIAKLLGGPFELAANVAVFFAAATTVYALATAVSEHFGAAALVIVVLPWLTLLAEYEQQMLPPAAGYALVVVAAAGFAFALRPGKVAAELELRTASA